jgi:hypothetical protein
MIVDKIMTHKVITIALKYLCFGVNFVYNYAHTNEILKTGFIDDNSLQNTICITFFPETTPTSANLRASLYSLLSGSPNLFYLNT